MYNHFITPKDAFRLFDVNKNGSLVFSEFKDIIINVYRIGDYKKPNDESINEIF